jgi:VWFA-related protein
MPNDVRCCLLFLVALLLASTASAQQSSPTTQPAAGKVVLDVVVTAKSGTLVSGLQQQDFTILDNKTARTITSFEAVEGRQAPVEVVLLVDAVNAPYQVVAFERDQIDKFLRAEGGDLAHRTAVAFLTDSGLQFQHEFSTNGNTLSASLDRYTVSLRDLRRSAGFWGAVDRFQISLNGLHELVEQEAAGPGRKIILCISPGWPLLSGPEVELDKKEEQQLFGDIVDFSTEFLRDRITLYSINPWGPNEPLGRETYWESFEKGIDKPSQVNAGDLAAQVLATQSGGVAFNATNDLSALVEKSLADTRAYYEISFDPPMQDRPNEYHRLEIHIARPGVTARTRQGYYSGSNVRWGSLPKPVPAGNRE